MAKEQDPLWEGGHWEQSSPRYAPPKTPNTDLTAHIRRSQSIRHFRQRLFRWMRFGAGVSLTLAFFIGIGIGIGGLTLPNIAFSPVFPGGYAGSYLPEEPSDTVNDPKLPQADLLEENLIGLSPDRGIVLTPQQTYEKTKSSIVYIETLTDYGIHAGTGVILSEDGYIVTNAHVISDATEAVVTLWDESYYTATVVGWDLDEDLAVLKIDAEGLSPAVIGNSSDLKVGDTAYAIGNPLGSEYRSTFTDGIISALDRYLDIDGTYMSLIQTTTPINMGNSGGALLNDRGQVVGITTIKIMSSSDTIESMGFAIPSTRVVKVVNSLVQGIELTTPALGVTIIEVTDPIRGLRIDSIAEDSYADEAGLLPGDILTHAAGTPLYYNDTLSQVKDSLLVGDTLTVTVYRDGLIFDLDVVLSDFNEVHPDE